ncbi:hypothetical protein [Kaarinaea lacus]
MSNGKFLVNSHLKLSRFLFALIMTVILAGCGDDAFTPPEGTGTNTNNNPGGGGTTTAPPPPFQSPGNGPPAHTIALSYSQSSSIEHVGGGIYRRGGTAIVTDADGHAVADGTIIQLSIIDSVIAQGSIDANDLIQGNTISDLDVSDGGGIASLFTGANVIRNAAIRYILPGDHVFLTFADGEDKDRVVNVGGILDNQISVNQLYSRDYPDAVDYQPGTVGYLIGASLLGAEISGLDLNDNPVSGYSMTKQGIAKFYITYPANVDAIWTGCYFDPTVDTRALPAGSAQVYMVATVTNAVTTIDNRFCFSSIAGGALNATPKDITSSSNIRVSYVDGGDGVRLPFATLNVSVSDANGSDITLNGAVDKSGFVSTDDVGIADFFVQINTPPATGNATITITAQDPAVEPVTVTVSSNNVVTPPIIP